MFIINKPVLFSNPRPPPPPNRTVIFWKLSRCRTHVWWEQRWQRKRHRTRKRLLYFCVLIEASGFLLSSWLRRSFLQAKVPFHIEPNWPDDASLLERDYDNMKNFFFFNFRQGRHDNEWRLHAYFIHSFFSPWRMEMFSNTCFSILPVAI